MNYFIDALKKYADFSGRATRTQYWMFILMYIIIYVVLAVIDTVMGMIILSSIFTLGMLIPSISIAARRLHDTGRSGWWQLIMFLPLIGVIVLLVFYVQDSVGDNQFGANPKAAAE